MTPELAKAIEAETRRAEDTCSKIEAFFSCVSQQQWLPKIEAFSPFDHVLEADDDQYDVLGAICVFEQLRRDRAMSLESMDDAYESYTALQWFASSNRKPIRGFGISAGSRHHLVISLRHRIINSVWEALGVETRFHLHLEEDWVPLVTFEEIQTSFERIVIWGTRGARPLHRVRNLWHELSEEYDKTITLLLQFPKIGLRGREPEGENCVPILAANRTKPMTLREAAKRLGKTDSKDSAEWLRKCIDDGEYRCEKITRQQHVFDKNQFPESVWPAIMPHLPEKRS